MATASTFADRLRRWLDSGWRAALRTALRRGVGRVVPRVTPFYYLKEALPASWPAACAELPEGFRFALFGAAEVQAISRHPERGHYVRPQYALENLARGDTCLGIMRGSQIVGFTWYSLTTNRSPHYPCVLQPHEAYLYDMYVFRDFRGHALAPILRYRCYQMLHALGRDTFYSVTECANKASLAFKRKLGARIVMLGLYISCGSRYRTRLILFRRR